MISFKNSKKSIIISLGAIAVIAFTILLSIQFSLHKGSEQEAIDSNQSYKNKTIWFDLMANKDTLNTKEKVENIVNKVAKANIDTIVLDVKSSRGFVAYLSNVAPHLSNSQFVSYPEGYDVLEQVINIAHSKGIKVHASVNIFAEGNNIDREGTAFIENQWQTVYYSASRAVEAQNGNRYPLSKPNVNQDPDQLTLYTSSYYNKTINNDVAEALIVDGRVSTIYEKSKGALREIPEMGIILSGQGKARSWILENLKPNQKVDLTKSIPEFIPAADYATTATFVNPVRKDVQNYELSIVKEIISNYNVDGFVIDRARYSNIYADFSKLSRESFEGYLGEQINNWPGDIFEITFPNGVQQIERGPLFKKWIEWRASNIQSFFSKVEKLIHDKDESLKFGTYVGSWYPTYYNEGVNWASQTFIPEYNWASPTYNRTGYAELLDYLMTGNYYKTITKKEAVEEGKPEWASVEGSAEIALKAVKGATPVYGSLYVKDYEGSPNRFRKALQTLDSKTNSIMIFDLFYIEKYDWWHILEDEFDTSN
jgi:uncharacterized lipoprotein YddW (UPF0748 family)